jgi:ABC-type dipeptide/oligopeptide/nickel transport system permease subunit
MNVLAEKKGLIIFGVILLVVLIAALAAYQMTGNMGIEDRYNTAVGLPPSTEEGDGGTFFGFSAEGNPVLYVIILGILIVGAYAAYKKFRV